MKKTTFTFALFGIALLTGCQSSPSQSGEGNHQPVWVAKDLGLKQCEQSASNNALNKTQQSLDQNQVQVLNAHCADDGMMRTQVCGAVQGKLGIYKIAAFQLEKAQSLGFKQVQENQYKQVACS
ncbi:hypothetical protein [Alkanindiges illinoisensis]|uniref:hypothetical protein n=1 Tax=Alkanindiges illinoisensis TaxID=197183 RepID=UPI000555515A|nr:hypothetical protein [Alkanindiges illinoisensis]